MNNFFEFTPGPRPRRSDVQVNTDAIFLAHDSYLNLLFDFEDNNNIAIRVREFEKFPNVKVSWLSVSSQWISSIQLKPHPDEYHFILSKQTYTTMRQNAPGNAASFRVRKSEDGSILVFFTLGSYTDITGGGGTGLLHGAKVPPTP